MLCSILGFILIHPLIAYTAKGERPTWKTPEQRNFNLDISKDDVCSVGKNVLDTVLYAESSGPTVSYRVVSISPEHAGAFRIAFSISWEFTLECYKEALSSSSYSVTIGAYYEPRTADNEAIITLTIMVSGLPEPKKPVFTAPDPNNPDLKVYETSTAGAVILTLAATDEDTNDEDLTFNMDKTVAKVTLDAFEMVGRDLKIIDPLPPGAFDIEGSAPEKFPIVLEVSDGSTATTLSTDIVLQDVNDNKPVFTGETTTYLAENSKAGNTVFIITATDKDKSEAFSTVSLKVDRALPTVFELTDKKILVAPGAVFNRETSPFYTLIIEASDGTLSQKQFFTVNIKAAPVFVDPSPDSSNADHKIYICETLQKTDEIMQLIASDEDSDVNTLTFSLKNSLQTDDVNRLFEIVGNSLKVKADVPDNSFDFEKEKFKPSYQIVLTVTDETGISTTLTTTIVVEDFNEFAPEFTNSLQASILETSTAGTSVLKLQAADKDGSNNEVSFVLSGGELDSFELGGANNNEILVKKDVKFDYATKTGYLLEATATDSDPDDPQSATATITVRISTAPVFNTLNAEKTATVNDGAGPDTVVYTLDVTDKDETGTLSISIAEQKPSEIFRLDKNELKPKQTIEGDVENLQDYKVKFKASDGTNEVTSEYLTVTIKEVNDNDPVITGIDPSVEVLESAKPGHKVYTVEATDKDIGNANNVFIFSMTESGTNHFVIGEQDGIIQVNTGVTFDYSTKKMYELVVTVKDGTEDTSRSASVTVTVLITTEPVFVEPNPDSSEKGHIISMSESAQKGDTIKTLVASDKDSADASLRFSIVAEKTDVVLSLFEVVDDLLKVQSDVPGNSFDYEKENAKLSFKIKLKVTDETGHSTTLETTIEVEDANEFAPEFTSAATASIAESASAGTTVIKLQATDKDGNADFNKVSFTLSGDDVASFELGGTNKDEVLVKEGAQFDYKTKASHQLKVTATDSYPDAPKTAEQGIIVKILTAPKFTSPINGDEIDINENSPAGSSVKMLEASDEDGDSLTFELVSQVPADPEKFELQDDELKTKDTFNVDIEEPVLEYTLKLKVTDGNEKTMDDEVEIIINIKDSNTQTPKFKTDVSYEASVKETAEIGFKVITVTATDDDLTEANNKITFSLPDTMTAFKIDAEKGEITVAGKLSYESQSSYDITVTAKDSGGESATQSVKITIFTEPTFKNLPGEVEIKENIAAGSSVFKVSVMDVDNTWDKKIEIASPLSGNIFKMEGDTLMTNTNDFDAETTKQYELTFKVTDGDNSVTSDKLTINIIDVNDNYPLISNIDDVTIPENSLINAVVIDSITASDKDVSDPNNVLTYAITSGNDDNTFKIEESSGKIQLILNSKLSKLAYTLEITVSDKGEPVKSVKTEVTISVDASTIDECADKPCKNGATCSSSVNTYTCKCVTGFEGDNCETNINECEPNPCLNGGTCTDGINMYTCDCAKGWGGSTCATACTGNTYGKNCGQTCNCDATRLIENVQNQQCDIKEGACKCNTNYVGPTCEDRDECSESQNICGDDPHNLCENTVGSYNCVCEQFYRKQANVCTRYEEDRTVPVDLIKEKRTNAKRRLDVVCPPGLKFPNVYNKVKSDIEEAEKKKLPSSKSANAFNIRCGSLDYDLVIVVNEENVAKLANELAASVYDTFPYDGKNVTVEQLEVNGVDVMAKKSNAEKTCAVYTSMEQCSSGYVCKSQNGLPTCQKEEDDDNLKLILGLGLGVCLPLLLLASIAATCLYRQLKKSTKQENSRMSKAFRKELSPWHGQMKQNGFRIDTRDYNRYAYDNEKYIDSFSRDKNYHDLPGLSYTNI